MPNNKKDGSALNNSRGSSANGSGNELIPIVRKGNEDFVLTSVLYEKLGYDDEQMRRWIRDIIADYGFIKGLDFFTITGQNLSSYKKNDYLLSLDMAKEIAMIQRTEMGRQVRKYFIEMEKRARQFMGSFSVLRDLVIVVNEFGRWYVYAKLLDTLKYARGGSAYKRQMFYPKDFMIDGDILISEEFAYILADSKRINNRRKELRAAQIKIEFPEQGKTEGGSHE